MALSGSKSVAVTKYDTLVFSWSASQNINGNYSTINWKLQLKATSNGRISSTAPKDWSVTVNGTKKSGTNTVGISAGATRTLASGSTKVNHNSDGSKTFSFSFSQEFSITFSGSWIGTKSGSGSATLNTIPRATQPTLSKSSIALGTSVTINLPRASSAFTHRLTYKIGTKSGTISTNATTSASFTPPVSLADQITNDTSGKITITCTTYNGSTSLGSKTATLTVTVPSSVAPTITSIMTSEATTGLAAKFGAYVQGKSKLNVSISASGASGSTIKYYHVEICDYIYTSAKFTTYEISGSGSVEIKATVTDSRGNTATRTETIEVLPYTPPVLTAFDVVRGNSSGEKDDQGTYAIITLDMDISPVGNKNDKFYTIQYKTTEATEWTTLLTGSEYSHKDAINGGNVLSADYTYIFKITVSDYFTSDSPLVAESANIPSTFSILDFLATGEGVSFGRAAEENNLASFMETKLQNKTYAKNHIYLDNDIAIAAMLSNGNYASLLRMNPSDQVELNWTTGGLKGRVFKKLWSGTWGSGNITVPELAYYNLFLFEIDGSVTRILAQRINNNYVRGVSCQLTSGGNIILYGVNVITDGTSLKVDSQSTGSPAFSAYLAPTPNKPEWRLVLNIWGVL